MMLINGNRERPKKQGPNKANDGIIADLTKSTEESKV